MLINVYAAQTVIVLAAAAAMLFAIPEGCRRVFRKWQLLFPPALAALAAIVQLIYPSLLELNQPEIWELSIVAAVIGVARGQFMRVDVDQIWNVVRLPRAPEGLLAAIMLMLFAIIGGGGSPGFRARTGTGGPRFPPSDRNRHDHGGSLPHRPCRRCLVPHPACPASGPDRAGGLAATAGLRPTSAGRSASPHPCWRGFGNLAKFIS